MDLLTQWGEALNSAFSQLLQRLALYLPSVLGGFPAFADRLDRRAPAAHRGDAYRMGQDPAQSSSIILTTVTDVVGFFSFLGIATLLASLLESAPAT